MSAKFWLPMISRNELSKTLSTLWSYSPAVPSPTAQQCDALQPSSARSYSPAVPSPTAQQCQALQPSSAMPSSSGTRLVDYTNERNALPQSIRVPPNAAGLIATEVNLNCLTENIQMQLLCRQIIHRLLDCNIYNFYCIIKGIETCTVVKA